MCLAGCRRWHCEGDIDPNLLFLCRIKAGIEYALFTGAMDTMANVCDGNIRISGRAPVPNGSDTAKESSAKHIWGADGDHHLWWNHESGSRIDMGRQQHQLENDSVLLCIGIPDGLCACICNDRIPADCCRTCH